MQVTRKEWRAACAALGLDPETTHSINISPFFVRVVHADQATTSQPIPAEPDEE